MNRRKLITGLISFAAAPAIVRIESIMPVKAYPPFMTLTKWGQLIDPATIRAIVEMLCKTNHLLIEMSQNENHPNPLIQARRS